MNLRSNRGMRGRMIEAMALALWVATSLAQGAEASGAGASAVALQCPPAGWDSAKNTLSDLLVLDNGRPVTNAVEWKARREQLRERWLSFFGTGPAQPPVLGVEVVERSAQPDHERQLIRYRVELQVWVEAYLLLPTKPHAKRPGAVVLHPTTEATIRQPVGLDDAKKGGSERLGLDLVRRGYAVICPENYLWIQGRPRLKEAPAELLARYPKWNGMAKMTWDASRAVDVLISGGHCDPKRIGCIGHSLGAKESLYLAAFDERIAAAVSSEGGIGLQFSNWQDPWYLGSRIRQPEFKGENHEVLAMVAPRPFLLLAGESADGDRSWAFIERGLAVYRLLGAADRIGMYNHRRGHTIPDGARELALDWLDRWLAK